MTVSAETKSYIDLVLVIGQGVLRFIVTMQKTTTRIPSIASVL